MLENMGLSVCTASLSTCSIDHDKLQVIMYELGFPVVDCIEAVKDLYHRRQDNPPSPLW